MKAHKNNEKCFLFNLKSSYGSQDIQIFVRTYYSCKKDLIVKAKVNFNIYKVTTWEKKNWNTYRVKYFKKSSQSNNQIWLVNRNIFHETFYPKCVGETIPSACSKNSKLSLSLSQQSKVLYSLFLLCAKLKTIEFV